MKFRTLSLLGASFWVGTAGISRAELLTDLTPQEKELFRHACEERVTQDSYISGHPVELENLHDPVVAESKKSKGTKPKKGLDSTLQHAKALYEYLDGEFDDEYEKAAYQGKVSLLEEEEIETLTFQFQTTAASEIRGLENKETHLWIYPKLSSRPESSFFLYCTGKEEHTVAGSYVQIRKGLSCRPFSSRAEYGVEKDMKEVGALEKVFTKPYPNEKMLKQLTSSHLEALRLQYEESTEDFHVSAVAKLQSLGLPLAKDRYEALLLSGDKRYTSRSLRKCVGFAKVGEHLVKSEIISHGSTQWIFPVAHNPGDHYLVCTSSHVHSGASGQTNACGIFQRSSDRSFPIEFK